MSYMPSAPPSLVTTVSHHRLAAGDRGARQTLELMRRLVNSSIATPVVVRTAKEIIRHCAPRDDAAQALAIRAWLEARIRFCRDPRGVELLHTPAWLLREIAQQTSAQVDCDDAAILGAALAKAVGLRAVFECVAFWHDRSPYQHVYTLVPTPRGVVELDVTRSAQQFPPAITRRMRLEV